jgi:hypothetical protein
MILPPLVFSAVQFQFSRYTQTQCMKWNCVSLQVWSSFIFCHNETNCGDLVITVIEACDSINLQFQISCYTQTLHKKWSCVSLQVWFSFIFVP